MPTSTRNRGAPCWPCFRTTSSRSPSSSSPRTSRCRLARLFVHGIVKALLDREATEGTAQELSAVELKKRMDTLDELVGQRRSSSFIVVIAGLMVLGRLGLDIGPAIAGLGVVGIAVGFGAQSLVRDYLNGALILIENQFGKGDVIRAAGVAGTRRGLHPPADDAARPRRRRPHRPERRDQVASNLTRVWSRINQDVTVAYGTDIDKAIDVVDDVGRGDGRRPGLEAPRPRGAPGRAGRGAGRVRGHAQDPGHGPGRRPVGRGRRLPQAAARRVQRPTASRSRGRSGWSWPGIRTTAASTWAWRRTRTIWPRAPSSGGGSRSATPPVRLRRAGLVPSGRAGALREGIPARLVNGRRGGRRLQPEWNPGHLDDGSRSFCQRAWNPSPWRVPTRRVDQRGWNLCPTRMAVDRARPGQAYAGPAGADPDSSTVGSRRTRLRGRMARPADIEREEFRERRAVLPVARDREPARRVADLPAGPGVRRAGQRDGRPVRGGRGATSRPSGRSARASGIDWSTPFETTLEWDLPFAKWFTGGELNVAYNCVDRHVERGLGDKVAYHWIGEPGDTRTLTFRDLQREVSKAANALKELGVTTGDRVAIYMPMIPELPIAMLACARIGAPHTVVFGGFSRRGPVRAGSTTAGRRSSSPPTAAGGAARRSALKHHADEALADTPDDRERASSSIGSATAPTWSRGRDHWWHDVVERQSEDCPPVAGRLGAHALPALHLGHDRQAQGHPAHDRRLPARARRSATRSIFDIKPDDVYWCAADIGWVTGHSYIVYGPLANATTGILYEGAPGHARLGSLVADRRGLQGLDPVLRADRHPGVHEAGRGVAAQATTCRRCACSGRSASRSTPRPGCGTASTSAATGRPIVDTWWQTETGQILITPLPGVTTTKPGSATFPFPGIDADVVDARRQLGPERRRRLPRPEATVAGDAARHLRRPGALQGDVLEPLPGDVLRRRRRQARRGRLPVAARPRRRRDERRRPPDLDDRGRIGAGRPHSPSPRPRSSARRTTSRARRSSRSSSCKADQEPSDALAVQLREHVAYVIGPIARPEVPDVRAGPAQDPIGQDHAAAAARHRRGARPGRHDDPGRCRRRRDDPREQRGSGGVGVPFDFLTPEEGAAGRAGIGRGPRRPATATGPGGIPFDGLTEDWHLVGRMQIDGRLSDALNKREPIAIADVQLGAGRRLSEPLAPAPGLKSVDPYDLILVLAGEDSLPGDDRRRAFGPQGPQGVATTSRLEVPPYRVVGTVYALPGLRAGPAAGPLHRDVRAGRRRDAPRWAARPSPPPGTRRRSWSTARTCAASSRSTYGPASGTRSCPGASLGGDQLDGQTR